MRRLHLLFPVIILLLLLSAAVSAEPAGQGGGLTTSVTQSIWLRTGPGTQWRKLTILSPGTTITLDGYAYDGLWVRGITSAGDLGWIAGRYVAATQDAVFTLPPIGVDTPSSLSAPAQGSAPAAPSGSEAPAPAAVGGGIAAAATANVNMRGGPGIGFRRIGGVLAGHTINIDGRDGSTGWVRGINESGIVGWVSAAYISLNTGQVAGLPVVDNNTPFGAAAPGGAPAETAPGTVNVQPVASTAPVSGFSYGGHVAGFSDNAANWMRSAGMTWVKHQWRYSPGQDPGAAAGLINNAHARGFRILLGVVGHVQDVNAPGYFDQFAGFLGGLAGLGTDAIEVWNEQNIDREWPSGSIDPGRYTQMLAQAYNAIKSVNPNTLVISGALAPTGFFGGCHGAGCDDAPYISGMAAAGAANYMDCLGIHYNEGIVSPSQTSGDPRSEHYTRYFWGMVNTYWNAFGGRRPLCFTELGYLSPEGFGALSPGFAWAGGTSVAQHAAWLDQAVSLAGSSGKVRLLIIWNVDFQGFGVDPMAGYAIIRPDGSCPACNALAS